jgi:TfoX/Sxy family transcriptional regulator of competence genes
VPYNQDLDYRVVEALSGLETARKRMFGGTCHLLNGNMMCGVYEDYLILRLGVDEAGAALGSPGVKPMDITGTPMKGWVMVEEEATKGEALAGWIEKARAFTASLPPK